MGFYRKIRNRLRGFCGDSEAAATVEFVIVAPLLLTTVFSVFESGWLMTQYMMLDRGIDMAVRDLRLAEQANPTQDSIKARVCEFAHILRNCQNSLLLELKPIASSADIPHNNAACVNRSTNVNPVTTFNPGARSEIMFMRACIIVDPMFPGMGLGLQLAKDASGGYAMVAHTAFVNEPE